MAWNEAMIARASKLFLPTLRDAPADAEAANHIFLVRGAFVRQVTGGVWTFLPLGWRVHRKIEQIIRDYLVSHPDLIEEILVTHSRHFIKHFALRLNPLVLGKGLLSSEGDFWLKQRRLAQPVFNRGRINSYAGAMTAIARRVLRDAGARATAVSSCQPHSGRDGSTTSCVSAAISPESAATATTV